MRRMKFMTKTVSSLASSLIAATSSYGALNLQLSEVGSDVVGIYSGSIDVSTLTPWASNLTVSNHFTSTLDPNFGYAEVSSSDTTKVDIYYWSAVSTGSGFTSQTIDLSSGGFALRGIQVAVPTGYTGGSISAMITLEEISFALMGIAPGDSGLISDLGGSTGAVTWSAVPELASSSLLIGAAVFCCGISLRRRRS